MIRHVAGIAEIVEDVGAAVNFYRDVLGLTVQHEEGSGYAMVELQGVLHFGIWSRQSAAEATLGDPDAADKIPLGFTLGFEVDDVNQATESVNAKGTEIAQQPKEEPWGQKTSRFFSSSGALCELSETPLARQITQNIQAES